MIEIRSQMRVWCGIFKMGIWILISLILCTSVLFLWLYQRGDSVKCKAPISNIQEVKQAKKVVLDKERPIWIPLPDMEKKLIYLQHNVRPDCLAEESSIYLGLEGGKEGVLVRSGEKIYLDCIDKEKVQFSKEKTPFWIEPSITPSGGLDVLFKVQYKEIEQEIQFQLQQKPLQATSLSDTGSIGEMRSVLNGGKVYPPDLLQGRYGGEAFSKTKGLYRLEAKGEVLFLKAGDLFVWKEEKFAQGEKATRGFPLLYVKSIEQGQCHCILWDEAGLISCAIQFPVVQPLPVQSKMNTILVRLHQRTDTSVTCVLQNKSMILKEGDWLLCSKQGWHNLRSAKELKEYLRYALKGELFIFDGIVKSDAGTFFTGHLFDETRAICQKVELPLKIEPPVKPAKGKKLSKPTSAHEEMKQFPTKGKLKNAVGCNDVLLEEEEGDS